MSSPRVLPQITSAQYHTEPYYVFGKWLKFIKFPMRFVIISRSGSSIDDSASNQSGEGGILHFSSLIFTAGQGQQTVWRAEAMTIGAPEPAELRGVVLENISRKHLVNILNHVNFKGGQVFVNLKKPEGVDEVSLRATPQPCVDDTVRLLWIDVVPESAGGVVHQTAEFLVDRGSRVVVANGQVVAADRSSITLVLPDRCYATSRRRMERFGSAAVNVLLGRGMLKATGMLLDFGGGCLRVRLSARDGGLADKSDLAALQIALTTAGSVVYEGQGTVKRLIVNGENVDLVVALVTPTGEELLNEPDVTPVRDLVATCRHPLSDRIVRLRVVKASCNSFIVNEQPAQSTLFAGLIIPEMKIDFGTGDCANCTAKITSGEADTWHVSILDMPVLDQRKLFSFIEKETGRRSAVSAAIDPDDLIEFFFEAGFIYPKKYVRVAQSRQHLRELLSHLYIDNLSIAQHFVQYDRGVIEAHIAMVRFYERSWVVHHHTAIGGMGAGSAVLSQIFRYIHGYSALPSTGMDYLMTYYRPENRFPNKVLGGFARLLRTPSLCSVDAFAYLHLHFSEDGDEAEIDKRWRLEPATRRDLLELDTFYKGESGGLTVKAFGLEAVDLEKKTIDLDAEFEKAGLRRRKSLFSLKSQGKPKAIIMALDSDDGLNMSNLMKCAHVFVIDQENMPFDQLMAGLGGLSMVYDEPEIPILIFPSSYVSDQGITPEKVYDLLIFDASIVKQFIEFVERLTNRAVRRKSGPITSVQEGETSGQ
jgi:hypothetical protein